MARCYDAQQVIDPTEKCEMGWPPCKRRAIIQAKRAWQNYWFKCCAEHAANLDDHDYEKINTLLAAHVRHVNASQKDAEIADLQKQLKQLRCSAGFFHTWVEGSCSKCNANMDDNYQRRTYLFNRLHKHKTGLIKTCPHCGGTL